MYSPAQQGFGRIVSQGGANLLGGLTGRSLEREAGLAGAGLAGRSALNAAKARGKAIEYQGRMQGQNALLGGLFGGLGSIVDGYVAGNFGGGDGGGDFSSEDAQAMGMPSGQADYIGRGGTTYWDTDMGMNQWKPMGFGGGYRGF